MPRNEEFPAPSARRLDGVGVCPICDACFVVNENENDGNGYDRQYFTWRSFGRLMKPAAVCLRK